MIDDLLLCFAQRHLHPLEQPFLGVSVKLFDIILRVIVTTKQGEVDVNFLNKCLKTVLETRFGITISDRE